MYKKIYLTLFFHFIFPQSIQLNEIVPSNGSTLFDEDNDSPDWIEIYNPLSTDLNLNGFCLSDDPEDNCKWVFPEYILQSETFLTIFASNKNRKDIVQQWDAIIDWGDEWKYWIGNSQPVDDWNSVNTNVSNWQEGESGFGYGDNDDNTNVPSGTSSIFVRKIFDISDKSVALIIKKYAFLAGLDSNKYGGHSLRSGFATSAAESGAEERNIMIMTGHKTTQMVRRYIQEANLFKNNALNKIKI